MDGEAKGPWLTPEESLDFRGSKHLLEIGYGPLTY